MFRKLKRDTIISIAEGKDLVGVYFEDTNGSEALIECSPKVADRIITLWNKAVEEGNSDLCPLGGDITDNCADCAYAGDYKYDEKTGECIER